MASRRATKYDDLRSAFKNLDEDDRERVLRHAEQLENKTTSPDSLTDNGSDPSYLAAADPEQYNRLKKEYETGKRPEDMAP